MVPLATYMQIFLLVIMFQQSQSFLFTCSSIFMQTWFFFTPFETHMLPLEGRCHNKINPPVPEKGQIGQYVRHVDRRTDRQTDRPRDTASY